MDSGKAYEERFQFWEDQDIRQEERRVYMTPLVASSIINRALLEVKDKQLGEDLEALKIWINKKQ